MLDAGLKAQLKGYLDRLTAPVEIVASLDEGAEAREMREFLSELRSLSPLLSLAAEGGPSGQTQGGEGTPRPSFALRREGEEPRVRFAGLPLGMS